MTKRNGKAKVPITFDELEKRENKLIKRTEYMFKLALKEEFGFGPTRIDRLTRRVNEIAEQAARGERQIIFPE